MDNPTSIKWARREEMNVLFKMFIWLLCTPFIFVLVLAKQYVDKPYIVNQKTICKTTTASYQQPSVEVPDGCVDIWRR